MREKAPSAKVRDKHKDYMDCVGFIFEADCHFINPRHMESKGAKRIGKAMGMGRPF